MMIKKKLTLTLLAIAATSLLSTFAESSDGTIKFTGKIVAANCTIPTSETTVSLPTVSTSAFSGAGSRAGQKAFTIPLTCTPVTGGADNTVSIRFVGDGTQVDPATGLFKLDAASTATNVGIAVYDANDGLVKAADNDSTPAVAMLAGDAKTIIPLTAWYQATAAAVTAGSVNASGTVELVYH
ncbi:fimbrial protein [Halomonas sp. V046]|uniref:fimbrial protein n=1 Tax=Halomonas sp. V046 TaxID=3459611 RepID=UPI0040450487